MNERPNLRDLLSAAQSPAAPLQVSDEAKPTASVKKAAAPRKLARSSQHIKDAATPKAWTRGEGKSSNPAYARMTVYVPTQLRKNAERKWEDSGGKDASDLIEHLLAEYLGT